MFAMIRTKNLGAKEETKEKTKETKRKSSKQKENLHELNQVKL